MRTCLVQDLGSGMVGGFLAVMMCSKVLFIEAVKSIADPPEAVRTALREARPDEVVCVTGSFFVAGEVRHAWQEGSLS